MESLSFLQSPSSPRENSGVDDNEESKAIVRSSKRRDSHRYPEVPRGEDPFRGLLSPPSPWGDRRIRIDYTNVGEVSANRRIGAPPLPSQEPRDPDLETQRSESENSIPPENINLSNHRGFQYRDFNVQPFKEGLRRSPRVPIPFKSIPDDILKYQMKLMTPKELKDGIDMAERIIQRGSSVRAMPPRVRRDVDERELDEILEEETPAKGWWATFCGASCNCLKETTKKIFTCQSAADCGRESCIEIASMCFLTNVVNTCFPKPSK